MYIELNRQPDGHTEQIIMTGVTFGPAIMEFRRDGQKYDSTILMGGSRAAENMSALYQRQGYTLTPEPVSQVEQIRAEVDQIAADYAASRDYEAAHSSEDQLHRRVLRLIADGADDAAELAEEALRTTLIDFPRSCA